MHITSPLVEQLLVYLNVHPDNFTPSVSIHIRSGTSLWGGSELFVLEEQTYLLHGAIYAPVRDQFSLLLRLRMRSAA
jgi:hypothetical protein